MSKPDAPPAPDYAAAARAQGGANVQSAIAQNILNRPNEVTPLGSRTWEQTGTTTIPGAEGNAPIDLPLWQSSVNFTPAGQSRFDQEQRIIGGVGNLAEGGVSRVADAVRQPFDFSSAEQARDRAEGALSARLEPKLARDREALRTQLINQGFRTGTEGYDEAMGRADEQATDARLQVINAAAPERDRMVQLSSFLRNMPLNELNALRSGSQVTLPQFQPYAANAGVAPAPVFGATQAAGNAAQQAYNTRSGMYNANIAGLGELGSAFVPWAFG